MSTKNETIEPGGLLMMSRETVARILQISVEGVKRLEKSEKLTRRVIGLRALRYSTDQVRALAGSSIKTRSTQSEVQ